jgi:hypothetical protein
MSTAFGSIVAGIVTRLQAAPAVSAQVYRARLKPVAAQSDTAVVVRIRSSSAAPFAILNGPTDWDTLIDIECYARSATLSPDAAADELLGAVYDRLSADPTLGGLVMDLGVTDLQYDFAAEADQMACVTLTLKALHRTNNLSLE